VINKPNYSDAPDYFHYYLDLVESDDLLEELKSNQSDVLTFFNLVPKNLETFKYQKDKWSVKMVFQHIIDCERLYHYRAFRFSRFDPTELAGFDVNQAMINVKDDHLKLDHLKKEFKSLRDSTITLFMSLTPKMLDYKGIASSMGMTPRSLGFMCIGHSKHHMNVIREKYLDQV